MSYTSNNNVNPRLWGRGGWKFLHSITLGYPNDPSENNKIVYKDFFLSLSEVLPCEKCRNSYARHLKLHNIDDYLNSREALVEWLIKIHNESANESSGRQYTYSDMMADLNDDNTNSNVVASLIICVLVMSVVCYMMVE